MYTQSMSRLRQVVGENWEGGQFKEEGGFGGDGEVGIIIVWTWVAELLKIRKSCWKLKEGRKALLQTKFASKSNHKRNRRVMSSNLRGRVALKGPRGREVRTRRGKKPSLSGRGGTK